MSVETVISAYQRSGSLATGLGIGLAAALGNRVIPRLPHRIFHLCDFPPVQAAVLAILINTRLKNPLNSFLMATFIIWLIKTSINTYAPETPPLGKLIAPPPKPK